MTTDKHRYPQERNTIGSSEAARAGRGEAVEAERRQDQAEPCNTALLTKPMTVGSLCTGIGGLDRGLEQAGLRVVWQCELDPYCRQVLAAHWPEVPCYDDVRHLPADLERVDLVCAGYPCQPFSFCGNRAGADDPRHLWPAVRDAIRSLRPRWALLENVPGHLGLGFDTVLADLAALGFDAEWSLISACSMGAPHLRERLFCVAYTPGGDGEGEVSHHPRAGARRGFQPRGSGGYPRPDRWLPESPVDRVAYGVPSKLVRAPLHALGNAVVPQVAEWVGRRSSRPPHDYR